MTPASHRILDELLASIAQLKALHDDPAVIPFGRGRARRKMFEIADRLAVEKAKPISAVIKPWTDHYQGNAS